MKEKKENNQIKKITLRYTLLSRCKHEIEVPQDFDILGNNKDEVFKYLSEKLTNDPISDIEKYYEGSEIVSKDFGSIDGFEIHDHFKGETIRIVEDVKVFNFKKAFNRQTKNYN